MNTQLTDDQRQCRYDLIVHLRDNLKFTFKQIGEVIQRSTDRAHVLYERAHRIKERVKWFESEKKKYPFYGLSVRVSNCLHNSGINTKEEALAAVKEGRIKPGQRRNYGWKSHVELCKWLDLEVPQALDPKALTVKPVVICPNCKNHLYLKSYLLKIKS